MRGAGIYGHLCAVQAIYALVHDGLRRAVPDSRIPRAKSEGLRIDPGIYPSGPLGFDSAQHRRTPRPLLESVCKRALRPFGSQ